MTFRRILFVTIVMLGSFAEALAQGNVQPPRRVTTVPATCDVKGITNSPMLWKISSPNPGLYTCIGGVYVHQTNTFGAGLVAKTMLYASAEPVAITSTAAPTNGQLLIGSTGAIPALGTLTGTANETLITNGAASITIGLAAALQHQAGSNFLLTDTTDTTKKFRFLASGITTGTVRDVTLPDANTTLPVIPQVLTFTGPTAARTITLFDANFTVARRNDFNADTNVAAPATPAAGITNTWTDATDKNLKAKDDAGVITVTVKPDAGTTGNYISAISTAGVVTKSANGITQSAYKTADETVTNSDTLQSDDHLTVTLDASSKYKFRFELFMDISAGGAVTGIKLALGGTVGVTSLKAQGTLYEATGMDAGPARVTTLTTVFDRVPGTDGSHYAIIEGTIETSTAGTLLLRFAQSIADVHTLTVQRNSSLLFTKLP